jgi:hypothetical protein
MQMHGQASGGLIQSPSAGSEVWGQAICLVIPWLSFPSFPGLLVCFRLANAQIRWSPDTFPEQGLITWLQVGPI